MVQSGQNRYGHNEKDHHLGDGLYFLIPSVFLFLSPPALDGIIFVIGVSFTPPPIPLTFYPWGVSILVRSWHHIPPLKVFPPHSIR